MAERVLYPNIPIGCLLDHKRIEDPKHITLARLDLDFNRTDLTPIGFDGIRRQMKINTFLEGFYWQGFNGNEPVNSIKALELSRAELSTRPELWDNEMILRRYLELLTSKLLCHQCPMKGNGQCSPLCLYQKMNPDLLVVPITTDPSVVRIEYGL